MLDAAEFSLGCVSLGRSINRGAFVRNLQRREVGIVCCCGKEGDMITVVVAVHDLVDTGQRCISWSIVSPRVKRHAKWEAACCEVAVGTKKGHDNTFVLFAL